MSDGGKHELKAAIAGLEAQRSLLGDAVVDPALAALHQQLLVLDTSQANFGSDEERKTVTLGFSYLWGGKFDLAEKWISDPFKSTAQTGDIVLESRRLTYLTVIHRRRGKVETARCYAERGLSSAASARMIEYVGMAKGNRAWVNLRDGDAAGAP